MDPTVNRVPSAEVSRREVVVRLGAGGLTALLLAAHPSMRLAAQEATPAGPVGVTADLMGSGEPSTTPGLELSLRRISIAPGGSVPPHSHPGALVIFTESGSWGYIHLGGMVELHRATGEGTPTAAEEMPVGEEVVLNAGDWLFVEDPQDDIRNTGEEDLHLLIAGLTRVGEPFTMVMSDMDMDMEATPTP
jgi:hypothetical protein